MFVSTLIHDYFCLIVDLVLYKCLLVSFSLISLIRHVNAACVLSVSPSNFCIANGEVQ